MESAKLHVEKQRSTVGQANGMFTHMINRLWGHSMARNWARLILERHREFASPNHADVNSNNGTNLDPNGNESFHHFHCNVDGGSNLPRH